MRSQMLRRTFYHGNLKLLSAGASPSYSFAFTIARPRSQDVGQRFASTYANQDSLPQLPLPKVEDTLDKFLQTVRPYLQTESDIQEVAHLVEEAKKDPSVAAAHAKLEAYAERDRNWLDHIWIPGAYMQWRVGLPIHSNVAGYLFGDARKQWNQCFSAAALTRGALLYHIQLLKEKVPASEGRGGAPQCMEQYKRMFSLNRVPGIEEDHLEKYQEQDSKHVIVIAGRRLYAVPVLSGREVVSLEDLKATFSAIQKEAKTLGNDPNPVPVLTSLPRTQWAQARTHMLNSVSNVDALHLVESSIFAVSLEDGIDTTNSECAKSGLVGDGRSSWFDKSFQLRIKEDGNPSINVEHSWADAPVPLGMFLDHALPYAEDEATKENDSMSKGAVLPFQRVQFSLDEKSLDWIREAERIIDIEIADSDVFVHQCYGLGRQVWKEAKISPDAAVHMAMQLAWRRRTGSTLPPPTYATIGMVQFFKGRTETCRVVSTASEKFVNAALSKSPQAGEYLRKACDMHVEYIQKGQIGRGIDRHLLGLRFEGATPELFRHPVFAKATNFILSTSNNSYISRPFVGGLFGAAISNGYGICYIPGKDEVTLCVESKRSSSDTDSEEFAYEVEQALKEVASLGGVQLDQY